MKVVVLAGGISTERAVSIVSGTMVCKALQEEGCQAVLVDVFYGIPDDSVKNFFSDSFDVDEQKAYIESFNDQVESAGQEEREFFGPNVLTLCKEADIVFLALHGEDGENGKVQAAFDLFRIRYTGSGYLSSALAMDKGIAKRLFEQEGIPCPKGIVLEKASASIILKDYGMDFPVVVKPCCGGSSVGVSIVNDQSSYEMAVHAAFAYEEELIIEEYIKGREFSVAVIDDTPYPVIEIAPVEGFYDYKNKYTSGAAVETCPAQLTKAQTDQMQEYAKRGAKALSIEAYSRLDFMMDDKGRMFCLEANTLPGMTPTSLIPQEAKAAGMEYSQLCMKLIEISLEKYR